MDADAAQSLGEEPRAFLAPASQSVGFKCGDRLSELSGLDITTRPGGHRTPPTCN
jgi:hypothetical protein